MTRDKDDREEREQYESKRQNGLSIWLRSIGGIIVASWMGNEIEYGEVEELIERKR